MITKLFRQPTDQEWGRIRSALWSLRYQVTQRSKLKGLWLACHKRQQYCFIWDGFEHCWQFEREFLKQLTAAQTMVIQRWTGLELQAIEDSVKGAA